MGKVFLYLYPIENYTRFYLYSDFSLYERLNERNPLDVLNECIDKRYRENGYQIVYAIYPDKKLFGVDKKDNDKVIYTDVTFSEASAVDETNNIKKDFTPTYPDEIHLLKQLGRVDELVIGGYHASDCVKRVAEVADSLGINTSIDLDLTDLFFGLYKQEKYFKVEEYRPSRYYNYLKNREEEKHSTIFERVFKNNYSNKVYGFYDEEGNLKDNIKQL